jgi:TfoX/Sxy family transcriptional regulator of competence genes
MAYDTGLVERVRDALRRLGERGAREKNVFGGRGFLFGKKTFLVVMDDGLLIKSAPAEYEQSRSRRGVEPFAPDGERPMSTWLVISPDVIADDPELSEWVSVAIRGVR